MSDTKEIATTNTGQVATIDSVIERACTDPGFDVDKLQKMLEMKERHDAKDAERAFSEAMADAQQNVPKIIADKFNKQTKSRYPSAASAYNAIKPVAARHGISIFVDEAEKPDNGMMSVRVTLQHRGGHKEVYTRYGMIDNKGPQGSANKTDVQGGQCTVTYLSRRMLCSLFSVIVLEDQNEDLDGNLSQPPISEDEVFKLNESLEVCESIDPGCGQRMFKHFQVTSLSQLNASQFNEAMGMCRAKMKERPSI